MLSMVHGGLPCIFAFPISCEHRPYRRYRVIVLNTKYQPKIFSFVFCFFVCWADFLLNKQANNQLLVESFFSHGNKQLLVVVELCYGYSFISRSSTGSKDSVGYRWKGFNPSALLVLW